MAPGIEGSGPQPQEIDDKGWPLQPAFSKILGFVNTKVNGLPNGGGEQCDLSRRDIDTTSLSRRQVHLLSEANLVCYTDRSRYSI